MKCRVCGCTEENACITDEGVCSWVMEKLCSACVVKIPALTGFHWPIPGYIVVPKMCSNCGKLEPDKEAAKMGYKNYWRCTEGRFDETLPSGATVPICWAWRTIHKPGKAVLRAQRHCPKFEVHSKWRRHD